MFFFQRTRWTAETQRVCCRTVDDTMQSSHTRCYCAGIFGRPNSSTGTPSCKAHTNHSLNQSANHLLQNAV